MQHDRCRARRDARKLRVVLIDDHAISRAACRALLRTEGADVVADLARDEAVAAAIDGLLPSAVIIDVTPGDRHGLQLAARLRALPSAPVILLTSSAARASFDARVDSFAFVAKADLCTEAIFRAIGEKRTPGTPDHARGDEPPVGSSVATMYRLSGPHAYRVDGT